MSSKPNDSLCGDGDERRQLVKKLCARVNKGLRDAKLTKELAEEYRQATLEVFARLSVIALERLLANARTFQFYASHDALTQAIKHKFPPLAKRLKATSVIKGMFDRDGTVHLDGGGTLRGRAAQLGEFYAHELTHAIDGVGHELSDSREWRKAWAVDIVGNNAFTQKAQADHHEAFSEVGGVLLSGGMSGNQLALICPDVVEFWRVHQQLLAGG